MSDFAKTKNVVLPKYSKYEKVKKFFIYNKMCIYSLEANVAQMICVHRPQSISNLVMYFIIYNSIFLEFSFKLHVLSSLINVLSVRGNER